VRDKYSTQTPELRTQADKEATAILTTADQEANKIVSDSKQKVAKMMEMIDRVAKSAEKRVSAVQEKAGAIGQKLKTSESGGLIRKLFDDEFTRLKGIREGNVQTTKTAAFKEAAEKERIGERYQGTKAYGEAISGISNIIKDSETGLLNVGPDELKVLTSIKNLLERGVSQKSKDQAGKEIVIHTPLSFQGLENERRKFRDRSFGLPAEGYDAIGQQRAGDIADYIEKIQKDFS
jgi:vacuolar-type H+-ATPase subunit H